MTTKQKTYPPSCLQCGKDARVLADQTAKSLGVKDARFFCSMRCAALWSIYKAAATQMWCGVRYEDAKNSDSQGPHGWVDDVDDECSECAAIEEDSTHE